MAWMHRLCLGGALLLSAAGPVQAAGPDRVLLLHSFGPDFSPWNTITPPFREELRKLAPNPIDIYEAALQAERFGESPANEEGPLIDYLNALLPDRNPRLVVAMGAPATRFVLRNRSRLFPSSPFLIAVSDERTYADLALTANDTACPTRYDPSIHIDHILHLLPDTRRIVVAMSGASATEQFWTDLFQRVLERASHRVTLEWFTHLAADDMVKRVAALPPHSVIYYPTIRVDGRGVPQEGDALLIRFIQLDRAPIFTHTDSFFGRGIVGGPMFSSQEMADTCAKVAARLLDGEAASAIKIAPMQVAAPRYDWRQLQKWGIKESLLPPGSAIDFYEPPVWEQYRWQSMLVVAIVLVQAALISLLLHERRRRYVAEVQSQQRMNELAHTNRYSMAGELTASIAHEINQPLGAILTNAETAQVMLKSPSPDLHELGEIVADIRRDDQRASEVILRLRSLLRKTPFELGEFDLNDLVRETFELLSGVAVARGVRIDHFMTAAPLPVSADRVQLQQVLINLMINAMDATADMPGPDREMSVYTARIDASAQITVSDSGPGIPQDKRKQIFEPFFTTKPQGMGMGLSIARTIIEAHHGELAADNHAGGGATFRIRLPIVAATEQG